MKVSSFIQNLKPYVPGKSIAEVQRLYGLKEIIKLASNENALGPSPKVIEAIQKSLNKIHLYPDGSYFETKNIISKKNKVSPQNICIGNGSNELIDLLIRVFCEPNKDKVLTAAQSFVAYKVCAHVNRCEITEVPLKKDFSIDIDTLLKSVESSHRLVFLPNPNNPTGTYISDSDFQLVINKLKNREDILIVVDEAYNEFVRAKDYPDTLKYFGEIKNLVLLRTFAKVHGIAGLRAGYMIAHPHVTDLIERVRLPFNVASPSAVAIEAALADDDYVIKSQKVVWDGLDYFYRELKKLNLSFCTSQGNFIFFDTGIDSTVVFEEMMKRGVILRPVKNYGFNTQMRMSVGTMRENEVAIAKLKEVLELF